MPNNIDTVICLDEYSMMHIHDPNWKVGSQTSIGLSRVPMIRQELKYQNNMKIM